MFSANITGAIAGISLADCSHMKDKPKKKRCDTCRKRVGLTGMLYNLILKIERCKIFNALSLLVEQ